MRYIALLTTVASSIVLPVAAAQASPVMSVSNQAICVPVVVETPDGPVEGVFCYAQGGRV